MIALLMTAILATGAPDDTDLRARVEQYWQLLEQRSRIAAAGYVTPATLQSFEARTEPPFSDPEVESLNRLTPNRFEVHVRVQRFIGNGLYEWPVVEQWVLTDGQWKVEVHDSGSDRRTLWQTARTAVRTSGLEVHPSQLRLHFLSRKQRANLVVHNGSVETVRVNVVPDTDDLSVSPEPVLVRPGAMVQVQVSYVGSAAEKDLVAGLNLELHWPDRIEHRRIPVRYNYVSPGARALLGLHGERLQALESGASLQPVVELKGGARSSGGRR